MENIDISETENALYLINAYYSNKNMRWIKHSINVAVCAYTIASCISGDIIDSQLAFRCGLLHDIGRFVPNSFMKHVINGYKLLTSKGYHKEAEVCLTHSFYLNNAKYYQGINDCSRQEVDFINSFLCNHSLDIYDKLIQLCDALATCDGVCIIEKRLVDVAMRIGFGEYTIEIWKEIFSRKEDFDNLCGMDIYNVILQNDLQKLTNQINKELIQK